MWNISFFSDLSSKICCQRIFQAWNREFIIIGTWTNSSLVLFIFKQRLQQERHTLCLRHFSHATSQASKPSSRASKRSPQQQQLASARHPGTQFSLLFLLKCLAELEWQNCATSLFGDWHSPIVLFPDGQKGTNYCSVWTTEQCSEHSDHVDGWLKFLRPTVGKCQERFFLVIFWVFRKIKNERS